MNSTLKEIEKALEAWRLKLNETYNTGTSEVVTHSDVNETFPQLYSILFKIVDYLRKQN